MKAKRSAEAMLDELHRLGSSGELGDDQLWWLLNDNNVKAINQFSNATPLWMQLGCLPSEFEKVWGKIWRNKFKHSGKFTMKFVTESVGDGVFIAVRDQNVSPVHQVIRNGKIVFLSSNEAKAVSALLPLSESKYEQIQSSSPPPTSHRSPDPSNQLLESNEPPQSNSVHNASPQSQSNIIHCPPSQNELEQNEAKQEDKNDIPVDDAIKVLHDALKLETNEPSIELQNLAFEILMKCQITSDDTKGRMFEIANIDKAGRWRANLFFKIKKARALGQNISRKVRSDYVTRKVQDLEILASSILGADSDKEEVKELIFKKLAAKNKFMLVRKADTLFTIEDVVAIREYIGMGRNDIQRLKRALEALRTDLKGAIIPSGRNL